MADARYVVGIDLGTTNSVVASVDTAGEDLDADAPASTRTTAAAASSESAAAAAEEAVVRGGSDDDRKRKRGEAVGGGGDHPGSRASGVLPDELLLFRLGLSAAQYGAR